MRWQQPATGPARRGAAGAGVGGGEGGRPPHPAAVSRNLQEAAGPGDWGERALRGAGGPGRAGNRGPSGGSAGKEGKGEGRAASPGAPRPPLRAGPRVAAAAAALPSRFPPDSDLASPGRAGAAARAALMARFRAAERVESRSLSGLGTCPSASRGLLSMESGASRWPQRAGSGRAQLGDQARRRRRLRAASPPPGPRPPASRVSTPPRPAPAPAVPGLSRARRSGPVRPSSLPHRFAHRYYFPSPPRLPLPRPPACCGGRDGLGPLDQGPRVLNLGRARLVSSAQNTCVRGRKRPQERIVKSSSLFCA